MVLAEAGEEFSLCQIDWGPVVSASVEIGHIMAPGGAGKIRHRCSCVVIMLESVTDPFISRTDERITAVSPHMNQPHSLCPLLPHLFGYSTFPPTSAILSGADENEASAMGKQSFPAML